jgi:hypothetical protein
MKTLPMLVIVVVVTTYFNDWDKQARAQPAAMNCIEPSQICKGGSVMNPLSAGAGRLRGHEIEKVQKHVSGSLQIGLKDLLRMWLTRRLKEYTELDSEMEKTIHREKVDIWQESAYISIVDESIDEDEIALVVKPKVLRDQANSLRIEDVDWSLVGKDKMHRKLKLAGVGRDLEYRISIKVGDVSIRNDATPPKALIRIGVTLEILADLDKSSSTFNFGPDDVFEVPSSENRKWQFKLGTTEILK